MSINNSSHEANRGGVPNRGSLYAVAAAYSKEAIETLYDLMKTSKNDGIRLGAAKAIINKSLPDLRLSDGAEYMPPPTHTMSPRFAEMINNMEYEAKKRNIKLGITKP